MIRTPHPVIQMSLQSRENLGNNLISGIRLSATLTHGDVVDLGQRPVYLIAVELNSNLIEGTMFQIGKETNRIICYRRRREGLSLGEAKE